MIKIEVTGNSIGEVADKLLAIGASLRATPAVFEHEYKHTTVALGAPAEVAEAAPAPEPTPEPTPPASASEPEVSAETLRALVLKLVASKGRETCEEVLSRFGVAKASEIDAERASELAAALEEAL